jgi:large subunit ribosomal protein L7Ae
LLFNYETYYITWECIYKPNHSLILRNHRRTTQHFLDHRDGACVGFARDTGIESVFMQSKIKSVYDLHGVDDTPRRQGPIRRRGSRAREQGWRIPMPVYVEFDVPADLADDALEALEVARDTGTVKKGTNETTKAIERGTAELVLVAEDVSPEEIVMHLPELADEKGITLAFVETQDEIGQAAGLEVGSAAAAIIDAGEADSDVDDITAKIEELR